MDLSLHLVLLCLFTSAATAVFILQLIHLQLHLSLSVYSIVFIYDKIELSFPDKAFNLGGDFFLFRTDVICFHIQITFIINHQDWRMSANISNRCMSVEKFKIANPLIKRGI